MKRNWQFCIYVLTVLTVISSLHFIGDTTIQVYAAEPNEYEYEYEYYLGPETWRVHLSIDGISTMHRTTSRYVGAFLAEHGVEMHPQDLLLTSYTRRIEDATMIRIIRAFYVGLNIDGDVDRIKVSPGTTAGELVDLLQEQFDSELLFDGSRNSELTESSTLTISSRRTRTEVVTEYIPYATIYLDDRTPDEGEIVVIQEGVKGERRVEYSITYISNLESSREIISDSTIDPVPHILYILVDKPEEIIEIQSFTYEVELLRWSYVRHNVIRNGEPLLITDVRSGITYWVAAFSQGNHADVEPITREDTELMRQAFGRWTWDPRPVWVTIDGRTIAASINGMPHAGSTNSNNGMNGHICLHFYGSTTHSGARSHERDHQRAVQEALRASR